MQNPILLFLALLSFKLAAQNAKNSHCDYTQLMTQGKKYANAKIPNYDSALLKFNSARRCDPKKGVEIDTEIDLVFKRIKAQRDEAERLKGLAQREKAKADKALEDLKMALKTVVLEQERAEANEKKAQIQAEAARMARDSAVAAQKKTQETLNKLETVLATVVRSIISDADLMILNLDYEAAWRKLLTAIPLNAAKTELAPALLEPAFWHAEAGYYARARGMLDTIAGRELLNNSSVRTLLRQLPQLDSTAQRLQLRECIRMLDEATYVYLQRRYYPVMVLVPGGDLMMGDVLGDRGTTSENFDEKVHPVRLSNFEIATTETTVWQLSIFCASTGIPVSKFIEPSNREDPGNKPGVQVSWYNAVAYANWLNARYWLATKPPLGSAITGDEERGFQLDLKARGFRLPTEAEWEYAARGGGKTVRFGNGKDIADPKEINFKPDEDYKKPYPMLGEYRGRTSAVSSLHSPNALGLHDMSGNVWEWCWDWYKTYPSELTTNYTGPESGSSRVLRGGSWSVSAERCRVADRDGYYPLDANDFYGFRLARTP